MGFNRGEWSELYTFLYLLINPNLDIVDENLKSINTTTFQVIELRLDNHNRYKINNDKNITKISSDNIKKSYMRDHIYQQNTLLLEKIISSKKSKGSFEIEEVQPLIDDLLDGNKVKGSSRVKGDLNALVLDKKRDTSSELKYNIKSNLGNKPTLLNASNHTNFIYEVINIDDEIMQKNNAIKGRKKLLDKYNFLKSNGAEFKFIKTQSQIFYNNLKLIDSNLDNILAQMLLLSYSENQKDIQKLLALIITDKTSETYYKKKIGDFANAVTFGMRAGESWNGTNEVNGGIIIVTKSGEVYLLDLIYFKSTVDKYLIDNIKLDSPSSTRYKMFEIYKENSKYYFKLNLQVRFK